jgi:transketolase
MASRDRLVGLAERAARLRIDSIRATTTAGSGHPTSSSSGADIVAAGVAGPGATVRILAVRKIPHSGHAQELLDRYGISARHIAEAARALAEAP